MNLKNWEKLISEKKKCLDFILEKKKKEHLFQLFDDFGVGGEKNISAPFSSFYSKGKKISLRFLTVVAPPSTLLSFISFFPSNGWRERSMSQFFLFFFKEKFSSVFCFRYVWMDRGWGGIGEELLIDMCHPICFFQVPIQQSHPSIPLTSSVSTLYSPFLWIFYGLVTKMSSPMVWNF